MRRARPAAGVLCAAALLAGCGIEVDRDPRLPGSTLRSTVVDRDGDGALERGPAEPLVDRTELAPRGRAAREVTRFAQITDLHVRDEESPARVPFLDRLGPPLTSVFRPQEALSPQVLTAAVRALNLERPKAAFLTGDLLDNAQRNELGQLLAVIGGGRVNPDSGTGRRERYRGVQQASNPDGFFYRPEVDAPEVPDLLVRAQREFFSPGLRAPWLAALGNHDLLVQGELPPSPSVSDIATGNRAILQFDERLRDVVDELPRAARSDSPDLRGVPPEAIEDVLERVPGRRTKVPPDPARRFLTARELATALRPPGTRGPAARLDYATGLPGGLHAIVLDTTNRAGKARGVLRPVQVAFLRRALRRAPAGASIVVVDHHGLARTRGAAPARALLARDERVIAELSGDTHRHEIVPRRTSAGGYWEIHTASLADWPQQTRMLRLVTGANGQRALETWVVDHAGGLDTDDLPGAARTLAYLDAQGGRPRGFRGRRTDRNARLWLPPRSAG